MSKISLKLLTQGSLRNNYLNWPSKVNSTPQTEITYIKQNIKDMYIKPQVSLLWF